ncbi:putative leader peptide [Candidatus Protofrankia californiensis]|uniref:putative leader peptide n=1 Tax=Candidatus Protofrankia californiensis TaxID=1839754 RepID=UPI003D32D48A
MDPARPLTGRPDSSSSSSVAVEFLHHAPKTWSCRSWTRTSLTCCNRLLDQGADLTARLYVDLVRVSSATCR